MSVSNLRKKIRDNSPAAKAFRRPATRGNVLLFSILGLLAATTAVWFYVQGGTLASLGFAAMTLVFGAVALDNLRRLGIGIGKP